MSQFLDVQYERSRRSSTESIPQDHIDPRLHALKDRGSSLSPLQPTSVVQPTSDQQLQPLKLDHPSNHHTHPLSHPPVTQSNSTLSNSASTTGQANVRSPETAKRKATDIISDMEKKFLQGLLLENKDANVVNAKTRVNSP